MAGAGPLEEQTGFFFFLAFFLFLFLANVSLNVESGEHSAGTGCPRLRVVVLYVDSEGIECGAVHGRACLSEPALGFGTQNTDA